MKNHHYGDYACSDHFGLQILMLCWECRVQPDHMAALQVPPDLQPSACAVCAEVGYPLRI